MNLYKLGWDGFFAEKFIPFQEDGLSPARVIRMDRESYTVSDGEDHLRARISGKFRFTADTKDQYPAVGDWVALSHLPENRGVIHGVLPRKSSFSRKIAGELTEEQIISANIDLVLLVSGLDGDFNLRRIERYIAVAYSSGAEPVIILNKQDLCDDVDERVLQVEEIAPGIPVYTVSATLKTGFEFLNDYLIPGKTIALFGSSGVGKSSIINCFIGEEKQLTREVREDDSRGRHTTTHSELIFLEQGAIVIDTPGMRELQMWMDTDELQHFFQDIDKLSANCKFKDCSHKSEPGCAVKSAIQEGLLSESRLTDFGKLNRELIRLEKKQEYKQKLIERSQNRKRYNKKYR